MGKKIKITIELDCEGCGGEETFQTFSGEHWSTDGDVIDTDEPHLHGPVGHDAGRPHVEGDPSDEGEGDE